MTHPLMYWLYQAVSTLRPVPGETSHSRVVFCSIMKCVDVPSSKYFGRILPNHCDDVIIPLESLDVMLICWIPLFSR